MLLQYYFQRISDGTTRVTTDFAVPIEFLQLLAVESVFTLEYKAVLTPGPLVWTMEGRDNVWTVLLRNTQWTLPETTRIWEQPEQNKVWETTRIKKWNL